MPHLFYAICIYLPIQFKLNSSNSSSIVFLMIIIQLNQVISKMDQLPARPALDANQCLKNHILSINFFDHPIHYKQIEKNFVIYRKKGWQQHGYLRTIVIIPGSAYLDFNSLNADNLSYGFLSQLPSDFQVIFTPFPPAPQNKFPVPVLHLQKSLTQLIQFYDKYRIDPNNIILGGYSCGGTMAVPLAIYFANQSYYFKSIMLLSPITDYSGTLFSNTTLNAKWKEFQKKDHRIFTAQFTHFLNHNYCKSKTDIFHPWYSPYFTPHKELQKLRNLCFIYGEYDYMRRTIEAFKDRLTQICLPSQSIVLNGEGHAAFLLLKIRGQILDPYPEAQIGQMKLKLFRKAAAYVKKILI